MFNVQKAVEKLDEIIKDDSGYTYTSYGLLSVLKECLLAGQSDEPEGIDEDYIHKLELQISQKLSALYDDVKGHTEKLEQRIALLEEIFSTHFPKQTLDITGKHLEKKPVTEEKCQAPRPSHPYNIWCCCNYCTEETRLRGKQYMEDMMVHGKYVEKDGKRIDPKDMYKDDKPSECESELKQCGCFCCKQSRIINKDKITIPRAVAERFIKCNQIGGKILEDAIEEVASEFCLKLQALK